jgi:hypothetical protein
MSSELARTRARRKRVTLTAVLLGVLGVSVVSAATASGGAVRGQASPQQVGTPFTIHKVGTVNVADLPAASGGGAGEAVAVPFLTPDPAALAAAKAGAFGSAPAGSERVGAKPKLTPGTQLPSAVSSNDDSRYTPPDMAFAIGGGYKMQHVNSSGRIWDPNNVAGPVFKIETFHAAGNNFVADPWMLFDQQSNRWFVGAFDITAATQRLAVSTSATPTTFNLYNVPIGPAGGCPDQGKGGVSDNVLAISVNEFANCSTGGYLGVIIRVLNKAELVAGAGTIHGVSFGPMSQYVSLVPAQSMTSTTDQWYAGLNNPSSGVAHIAKTVGTPPATVTFSEPFTPAIRFLSSAPNAPQPNTGSFLNTGDNRVQTASWQSNLLEFPASESCIPTGDSGPRACVRLLVVNTSNGALSLDKTISKKGQYLFYPASRPNAAGTHAVGYGRCSTSIFPELDAIAVNSAGASSKPKVLQTGDNSNNTNRYGDYFAVAIDPANTSNAWVAGEIGGHNNQGANRWGTAVREVKIKP